MPNTLSVYDPIFYAQEALIQLEKALGMAARVHRGYDKNPQERGSVISIRRPSTFSAQDAPSTAQDITASEVQVSLNQWKEVKFALTDKELSYTGERIIEEHIRPAAYALADNIDQALTALYKDVPYYQAASSPAAVADITAVRKTLFNNQAPVRDIGNLHLMLDGTLEAEFLNLAAFSQQQGAGDAGANTQMSGSLGTKYGFEVFANQNVATHTAGSLTGTIVVSGAHSVGVSSVTLATDAAEAVNVNDGDVITFAGDTQNYVVTADLDVGASSTGAVSISPTLKVALSGGEAVTLASVGGTQGLGFHRNAFALAMAPLSDMANNLGAQVATISDPRTNLSLRSRVFYVGDSSKVFVALDVLYGIKTLDEKLAVRLLD